MAVRKKRGRGRPAGQGGNTAEHNAKISKAHKKRWRLIRAGKLAAPKRRKKSKVSRPAKKNKVVRPRKATTAKKRGPGRPKGSKNKVKKNKVKKSAAPSKMAVKVTRAKRVSTTKRGPGKTKRRAM